MGAKGLGFGRSRRRRCGHLDHLPTSWSQPEVIARPRALRARFRARLRAPSLVPTSGLRSRRHLGAPWGRAHNLPQAAPPPRTLIAHLCASVRPPFQASDRCSAWHPKAEDPRDTFATRSKGEGNSDLCSCCERLPVPSPSPFNHSSCYMPTPPRQTRPPSRHPVRMNIYSSQKGGAMADERSNRHLQSVSERSPPSPSSPPHRCRRSSHSQRP